MPRPQDPRDRVACLICYCHDEPLRSSDHTTFPSVLQRTPSCVNHRVPQTHIHTGRRRPSLGVAVRGATWRDTAVRTQATRASPTNDTIPRQHTSGVLCRRRVPAPARALCNRRAFSLALHHQHEWGALTRGGVLLRFDQFVAGGLAEMKIPPRRCALKKPDCGYAQSSGPRSCRVRFFRVLFSVPPVWCLFFFGPR